MAKLLIVYGTTEGQTEKISDFLLTQLSSKGHIVKSYNASQAPSEEMLDSFDGFLIGSPVHAGKFNKDIRKWATRNFVFLQRKPSAFFSVCLGILQKDFKTKREEANIVANFFRESGWTPDIHTIFAGALKYSRYGWLKKIIMRSIAKKAGGDIDTSKDYEYTNWNEVRSFADRFEALILKKPKTVKMSML